MRIGAAHGTHLVQDHLSAFTGCLPGRLAAGQAAADDMNELVLHHLPI
jgi:hypothetical protein